MGGSTVLVIEQGNAAISAHGGTAISTEIGYIVTYGTIPHDGGGRFRP
jgi:hypothetical protein